MNYSFYRYALTIDFYSSPVTILFCTSREFLFNLDLVDSLGLHFTAYYTIPGR